MVSVRTFYDEHPINAAAILSQIADEGVARENIKPEDLSRYDQDHYGGLAATDALVTALRIDPDARVLDICSGMGGTSRYLAYRYGATVLGFDHNQSRVEGARKLTELVGLQHKVTYRTGDATHRDLDPEAFDRLISQEAFLHIDDRESLLANCHRLLKARGGLGFTDWTVTDRMDANARKRFGDEFAARRLVSFEEYIWLIRAAGFTDVAGQDLSDEWTTILRDRLMMYRSLETETVKRVGRQSFERYIRAYEFLVEQIEAGALGGGRFIGWK